MLNRKSGIRSHVSVSDLILCDDRLPFIKKSAFLLGQKVLLAGDRIAVLPLMNFTARIFLILKNYGHICPKPCFNTKIEEITAFLKYQGVFSLADKSTFR